MDEIEHATIESAPAPAAPARPTLWRRRPVQIAAAAVVVLAALGAWLGLRSSSTIQVHGSIQLTAIQYGDDDNPASPQDGDSCQGIDGYSDIRAGLTVTVEGAGGQVLASTLLQGGTMQDVGTVDGLAQGLCVLPFTVSVPAGQAQYAVAIAGRGAQEYSAAQLQKGVALSIEAD